jgi:hypothetical protein
VTSKQRKRALKKSRRAEAVQNINPCDYCGSLRHRAPGYLCRIFLADQRTKGKLGPYPSGRPA